MIVGGILVICLGVFDALTNQELYISIFYLIPISLVTWYSGKWWGVGMALASAGAWFINDILSGAIYSALSIVLWNVIVRLNFFLIITFLLSLLKTKLEMETRLARIDPLTKVANRRYFYELAEMEIHRANRNQKHFTVAYIDLDNFKLVNDRFGHHTGDTVLSMVASTIHDNLRGSDTVSRLGGDEFIILLPETNSASAHWVIFRLQNLLIKTMHERDWPVTFSIGVVSFTCSPASVDEILDRVDKLMYSAKKEGKNQVMYEDYCGELSGEE